MIIDAYYLNIKSFSNRYQSGIEWAFVGGRPRAIDQGTGTAKWFADVDVSITDKTSLDAIIAMLESYTGGAVDVNLADYEPIFGYEIDYSDPLSCYITSISAVQDTTSPLYTLTIGLSADLTSNLNTSVASDLRKGNIQSISRESGHSFVTGTKMSGLYGTSFAWNGKTADVEWLANKEDANILRQTLIRARSSIQQVGLALTYLFDEPVDQELGQTEYAYVLNVGECIPDNACQWFKISATLGKAQEPVQNEPPAQTYTDPRDSVVYNLVTINGLVWMAEGLRYANQGSSVNNNVANDPTYGRLYSQNEVSSSVSSFTDFRIPTQADWQNLIDFVGSGNIANIKSTTTWDVAGTNATGFDAKGAGLLNGGTQSFLGRNAFFWASEIGANGRTYMQITTLPSVDASVDTTGIGASYLFSVRYVKDV